MLIQFLALALLTSPPTVTAQFENGAYETGGPAEARLHQAGSISKYACTLAAFELARRGALSLDAPISAYLPELEGPAAEVSVRLLAQSRAGLPDTVREAFSDDPQAVLALDLTGAEAARQFAPADGGAAGERFEYHLVNWVLAQAVLEAAGGAPIDQLLETLVFTPAGMGSATVFDGDMPDGAALPADPYMPVPGFLACAGGLLATPSDLIALARRPFTPGGFDDEMRDALMTVTSLQEHYAIGGRVRTAALGSDERALVWLTGSNGAYKSVAVYDPVSDRGFAAMNAADDYDALFAARDAWLAERGYQITGE